MTTRSAWGLGLATVTDDGNTLDVWYPRPILGDEPADGDQEGRREQRGAPAAPSPARGAPRLQGRLGGLGGRLDEFRGPLGRLRRQWSPRG